jgi:ParB/RepB/Spo0J family partition protein
MEHADLLQPLTLFAPSPTNPRTRITQAEIERLAASIQPHGVLQPILARPWPDRREGEVPYEIVAGHRRWAATSHLQAEGRNPHAGQIPALIRELGDAQVLAIQLIENIAREDLHPLDEAAHYRRMRDAPTGALSVEEIAAVGKVSVSRVYERLSLLNLVPAAREAFLAEQLSLKTALQVARLPAEHQPEATRHLSDWAGEPMTPKAAAAFIRDRFMLRLAQAPFDPADAELLPSAGACGACPKRTGANPQLFGDITDADTCTDTACFGHKKAAQRARLVDELRSTGYRVLQDDEARDVCTADGRALKPTLLPLDAPVPYHLGDTALKVADVLDKAKVPTAEVLAIDHPSAATAPVVAVGVYTLEGALRRIKAHREQLDKKAEKEARPAPPAPAPAPAPAAAAPAAGSLQEAFQQGIDEEARDAYVRELLAFTAQPSWYAGKNAPDLLPRITKQQEHRAFAILAAAEVGAHMQRDGAEGLPPFKLAHMLCVLLSWDDGELNHAQAAYLAGVPYPFAGPKTFGKSSFDAQQAWMWGLSEEHAARLAMVLLASQQHRGDGSPMDHFTEAVLTGLEIPPAGLLATAQDVVKEVIQLGAAEHGTPAKAKKPKPAEKPASKKAAPTYRYRNAATGETWSGRGLQPKWLQVALENGAKLADFDLNAGGGL